MNPIWLTIVVSVLSVSGALGAQLIAGARAARLAAAEREARRDDRAHQSREDAYAKFLVAARAIRPAARAAGNPAATESALAALSLAALSEAGAHIELHAPDLADGPVITVAETAERLVKLARTEPRSSRAVKEAELEFDEALRGLRTGMRDDLGIGSRGPR